MDTPQEPRHIVPPDRQESNLHEIASIKYRSEYSPLRNPPPRNAVFLIDESIYQPVMPKTTHWSIGWADLMMTMFILFLSMFVYQATHKDFLVSDEVEVIGGDTSDALEIAEEGTNGFPFVPVKPGAPLITSGTVKKVESISLEDIGDDTNFFNDPKGQSLDRIKKSVLKPLPPLEKEVVKKKTIRPKLTLPKPPARVSEPIIKVKPIIIGGVEEPEAQPAPTPVAEPLPAEPQKDVIQELFTVNKENLEYFNLEKFASIKLIPDKTVRIILTGDLLFDIGSAELSPSAIISLHKIALAIEETPYMINIVGHTDNSPMRSERFPSNWELSLSRASSVARFLIEKIGMSPNQFVVSGYSAYRPVATNDNVTNRAKNRRVEIIISKKLPNPVPVTENNLQEPENL